MPSLDQLCADPEFDAASSLNATGPSARFTDTNGPITRTPSKKDREMTRAKNAVSDAASSDTPKRHSLNTEDKSKAMLKRHDEQPASSHKNNAEQRGQPYRSWTAYPSELSGAGDQFIDTSEERKK